MSRMQSRMIEGGRLHLHDGPIDLIIGAGGPERALAYGAARARFATVLDELCTELPLLRQRTNRTGLEGVAGAKFGPRLFEDWPEW